MSTHERLPDRSPASASWTAVSTYFVLAFAISWGGVVAVVGFDGFPGNAEDFRVLLPMVVIAMLAGPSVAGIAATALFSDKTGIHDQWHRFRKVRAGARWYAVALLTAPLVVFGVLMVLSLKSSVFRPGVFTASDPSTHLGLGLLTGIVAGLFEEIGWTGFAVPRLRLRYGVFATGLIVGLVWGAWHLLVVWWGSAGTSGSLSMAVYLPAMAFSFLVPYRVLMVWVYDRTDSLLLAMWMHTSLTASVRIFDPEPISGWSIVLYNLVLGAALWAVVAAVATAFPGPFTRSTAPKAAPAKRCQPTGESRRL
jgi:membrane protease YdiL (CAAX protease family)